MNSYTQIFLTDDEKNKLRDAAQIIHKIREYLPSADVKTTDGKFEISCNDLLNVVCTIYILADSPMYESIELEGCEPEYEIEPLHDIDLDLT